MSENYDELLQDIAKSKRDLNQLRIKNAQIQSQSKFLREQNTRLLCTIEQLTNRSQSVQSKLQSSQSQLARLRSSYESAISQMRQQIDSRQNQFQMAKEQLNPTLDFEMMRLKIVREFEEQYGEKLAVREAELERERVRAAEATRRVALLEEKLQWKEREASKAIDDLRRGHIDEIENLTKAISKSKFTTNQQPNKQLIRKLKRQIQDLRSHLSNKDRQLNDLHQQLTRMRSQSSTLITSNSQTLDKLREQVRIHQQQVNRLHKQLNSSPVERDKLIISQKDRDIRELTTKMEEMADELAAKDRRIERLREEMSGVEGELQRVSLRQNLKEDRQALELAQESLQQLQREHRRVLEQYENVKQLNQSLKDKETVYQKKIQGLTERIIGKESYDKQEKTDYKNISRQKFHNEITNNSVVNNKEVSNTETHTTKIKVIDNAEQLARIQESYKRLIEQLKSDLEKQRKSKAQLKVKYQSSKSKLKLANNKLMELIQQKIKNSNSPKNLPQFPTLLSPAPTIKKVFDFTSEPKTVQYDTIKENIIDYPRREFRSPPVSPAYGSKMEFFNQSVGSAGRGSDEFYQKSKSFKASKGKFVCTHHDKVAV